MENWKTTLGGLLLAIGVGSSAAPVPEKYAWIFKVIEAIGAALLGMTAKDFNNHSTAGEVEKATIEKQNG